MNRQEFLKVLGIGTTAVITGMAVSPLAWPSEIVKEELGTHIAIGNFDDKKFIAMCMDGRIYKYSIGRTDDDHADEMQLRKEFFEYLMTEVDTIYIS